MDTEIDRERREKKCNLKRQRKGKGFDSFKKRERRRRKAGKELKL